MWALVLVMLLPDGRPIIADKLKTYPSELACLWASPDAAAELREIVAAKAGVPPQSILPIAGCAQIGDEGV